MSVRLAWRNVRASARSYSLYFISLLLAVALFYAFGCLDNIIEYLDLRDTGDVIAIIDASYFLSLISVLVTLAFAFLLVHASRVLIASRRREFGIYFALGLPRRRASLLLVLEMAIVGILSLATGLLAGIGLTQILVSATASLLDIDVQRAGSVLSFRSAVFTVVYFSVILLVALVMEFGTLGRMRPGELLRTPKPRDTQPLSLVLAVSLLLAFVVITAAGIRGIHLFAAKEPSGLFTTSTLEALSLAGVATVGAVAVASFLFFAAVGPLSMKIASMRDSRYWKKLRPFNTREFSSRRGATVASAITTTTLFASISVVAASAVAVAVLRIPLADTEAVDATIVSYPSSIQQFLADSDSEDSSEAVQNLRAFNKALVAADGEITPVLRDGLGAEYTAIVAQEAEIDLYAPIGLEVTGITPPIKSEPPEYLYDSTQGGFTLVALSQYNDFMELTGGEKMELPAGSFALNHSSPNGFEEAQKLRAGEALVSVAGLHLPYSGIHVAHELCTLAGQSPIMRGILIVEDSVIERIKGDGAVPAVAWLNISYHSDRDTGDVDMISALANAFPPPAEYGDPKAAAFAPEFGYEPLWLQSATVVRGSVNSMVLVVSFGAAYLSLALLIIGATVTAIAQATAASTARSRYTTLAHLGADEREISRCLAVQTVGTFAPPLILTALFIVGALPPFLTMLAGPYALPTSRYMAVAACSLGGAYLLYSLLSYGAVRRIVRSAL